MDNEENGEISSKIKVDQDDSSLLDVFLESQEVEKSLRARRIDVSTLFFWSQVPQMLLSRDIDAKFYVSSLTGAMKSN